MQSPDIENPLLTSSPASKCMLRWTISFPWLDGNDGNTTVFLMLLRVWAKLLCQRNSSVWQTNCDRNLYLSDTTAGGIGLARVPLHPQPLASLFGSIRAPLGPYPIKGDEEGMKQGEERVHVCLLFSPELAWMIPVYPPSIECHHVATLSFRNVLVSIRLDWLSVDPAKPTEFYFFLTKSQEVAINGAGAVLVPLF